MFPLALLLASALPVTSYATERCDEMTFWDVGMGMCMPLRGNPWSGVFFLQVGGRKMWDL